jgi:hypothetical protein
MLWKIAIFCFRVEGNLGEKDLAWVGYEDKDMVNTPFQIIGFKPSRLTNYRDIVARDSL